MKHNFSSMAAMFAVLLALLSIDAHAREKIDEATIFAIFDQANAADIYVGLLGAKHGHSEKVRALGRMAASDHMAVQQMGRDLAKKQGITPTPPDHDTSIQDLAKTIAHLQEKSGAEFDKAYLKNEIAFHQSVIDAIKGTLLPAIHNSEFKELVNNVLPGFERHLAATIAEAKELGVE